MKNIRLGDVLIEFGYITPEQLNAALAYQKEHRDLRVGQALQELGYVNERQVLQALAKRLQIRMIDIEHTNVDVTAVEKVPQELAQKYDMLPIAQSGHTLTIAANYGGRWDILQAVNRLAIAHPEKGGEWSENELAPYLSMSYAPEPDLFIRTGGEERISNFLLWQLAYSEFYFTDTLWPEFDSAAFDAAIASYQQRERRFGRTSEQLKTNPHPDVSGSPSTARQSTEMKINA